MLVILECEGEEHTILTYQARVPLGDSSFPEIPAGMLDGSGNFKGVAADEIAEDPSDDEAILVRLDTYICDLKEAQIRGGLHCLGRLPDRAQLAETLVSLTRMPRSRRALRSPPPTYSITRYRAWSAWPTS